MGECRTAQEPRKSGKGSNNDGLSSTFARLDELDMHTATRLQGRSDTGQPVDHPLFWLQGGDLTAGPKTAQCPLVRTHCLLSLAASFTGFAETKQQGKPNQTRSQQNSRGWRRPFSTSQFASYEWLSGRAPSYVLLEGLHWSRREVRICCTHSKTVHTICNQ